MKDIKHNLGETIRELEALVETTEPYPITPESMASIKLCILCDLTLRYTPELEIFKEKIDEILEAGPPYNSKQIEQAILSVAQQKEK